MFLHVDIAHVFLYTHLLFIIIIGVVSFCIDHSFIRVYFQVLLLAKTLTSHSLKFTFQGGPYWNHMFSFY